MPTGKPFPIPVYQQSHGFIRAEDGSTAGATIGTDVVNADGTVFDAQASEIFVNTLPGSTYKTVQQAIDVMFSPGLISGGDLVELSTTSVRVEAGTAVVRIADDNVSELRFFDFPAQDFTIPDVQTTHYYRLEYNGGSPIITDNPADDADRDTQIPLGAASRADGFLNLIPNPYRVGDVITNLIQRLDAVSPVQRDASVGGLALGNTPTRTTTLSAGRLWSRVSDFLIPAKNSSVDTMSSAFYTGGTPPLMVISGLTQWDNLQYNDTTAGTLVAMGNNKYANLWFFMSFNGDHYGFVYGTNQYNTVGDAANEGVPFFLPQNFFRQYILLGRYIFEKGVDTPILIESAFDTLFTTSAINDHNLLAGLQGGAISEFYHLTAAQHATLSTFNPATKVNKAGDTMTGSLIAPNINATAIGSAPSVPDSAALVATGPFGGMFTMQDGVVRTGIWTQNDSTFRVGIGTSAGLTQVAAFNSLGDFFRKNADSTSDTRQPRTFVQSTDPGAAAAENDLWAWSGGLKRRAGGVWVVV